MQLSYKTIYLENGKVIEDHSVQVLLCIGEERSQHQVLERASEDLVSACYDSVSQSQRAVSDKSFSRVVGGGSATPFNKAWINSGAVSTIHGGYIL